jgi:hypothetical protein
MDFFNPTIADATFCFYKTNTNSKKVSTKKDCLNYLNEVITEMITSDVTDLKDLGNPYTLGLDLMHQFSNKVGKNSLVNTYFEGDIRFFKKRL